MESFAGKVAVVTGAASGIGRAIAERFGREGMKPVIADIQEPALAGARPEYFPVILALLISGVTARHSSISSIGEIVLVNGPIRDQIQMNSGIGALGPYNHANATIGRAYGLGSQNLQAVRWPAGPAGRSRGNAGPTERQTAYLLDIGNHISLTEARADSTSARNSGWCRRLIRQHRRENPA